MITNSPPPPSPPRRPSAKARLTSDIVMDTQRKIREGKRAVIEAAPHHIGTKIPSMINRVRRHVGLPIKRKEVLQPSSPSLPSSDPEDSNYPQHTEHSTSHDTSLGTDVEFTREKYLHGKETLQEMHFFGVDIIDNRVNEETEDNYTAPTTCTIPDAPPAPQHEEETQSIGEDDILKGMTFGASRYPHEETLDQLGITSDVESIFKACGLAKFMSMVYPTYPNEAAQFISTLSFTVQPDKRGIRKYGGGRFSFYINNKRYGKSLHDIHELFDFPTGNPINPRYNIDELHKTWSLLAGVDKPSTAKAKGARIKNPAINYARRAIAELFLIKEKSGPVNLNELRILTTILKGLFGTFPDGETILGDTANSDLAYQWMNHLLALKSRLVDNFTGGNAKPVHIGGPITALLKMCKVPLNEEERCDPWYIDEEYLRKAQYLDKKYCDGEPVYRFSHKDQDDALLVLPNQMLTAIDSYNNIMFNPPLNLLTPPDSLSTRPKKKKKKAVQAKPTQQREDVEVHTSPTPPPANIPPSPSNIEDYEEAPGTYDEYHAPKASPHVHASHERTNLLQKPVKWFVKQFKGLVRNLKDEKVERERKHAEEREAMERRWQEEKDSLRRELEEQRTLMTSLSSRFDRTGPSGTLLGRHSTSEGSPMDTSPVVRQPRRHSTSVSRMSRETTPTQDDERNDTSLTRRSRRRVDHTHDQTPYDQDVPMTDAHHSMRRSGRHQRSTHHQEEPSHAADQAGPSTAPMFDPALDPRFFENNYTQAYPNAFIEEQYRLFSEYQG